MLTLRTKIIISLICMSLVSIVVGGFIERAIVKSRFDQSITDRTFPGFMAEAVAYHQTYGSWEAAVAAEPFPVFGARFRPAGITVFRSSDEVQAGPRPGPPPPRPGFSEQGGPRPQLPPGERPSLTVAGGAPQYRIAGLDGKIWVGGPEALQSPPLRKEELEKSTPIHDGDELIGYAISVDRIVMSDLENQYLQTMAESMWITFALVGACAIPVGIFVGVWLSSPIKKLHQAVIAMQPGAVQQQVPVTSDDELGQLSKSFNIMSSEMASFVEIIEEQKAKIQETEALRKEGMASISHELRTPLNNCVAQANAMIDGIRPMDAEQMNLLSSSLDHLTKLVDDLFQLALADVNALQCAEEVVDFAALASEAIEARSPDAAKNGSTIIRKIPEQLEVIGDAKRLRQIIDNLLENSFRYAGKGAEINISLSREADFGELTVSDSGPGVPVEDLDTLFDRFYRADRSRDRETGGTGLGLSLVRAWAEAQGGSARAFLVPEGGLGIKVYVPLAKSRRGERGVDQLEVGLAG